MPTSGSVVRVSLATGLGTPDHLKICAVEAAEPLASGLKEC